MNCKFHPTAEAVTTCATCGAELCSSCNTNSFYRAENDKPACLECSLKKAEEDLSREKVLQGEDKKNGIIATIIWIIGVCLLPAGGFGVFLMLGSAIFFYRTALFMSDQRGFFEKIKEIFWGIVFAAILCPVSIIHCLIGDKKDVAKATEKVEEIKAALNSVK